MSESSQESKKKPHETNALAESRLNHLPFCTVRGFRWRAANYFDKDASGHAQMAALFLGGLVGAQAMELQGWMGMCILHDNLKVSTWGVPVLGDTFLVFAAVSNMVGKWALLYHITGGKEAFKKIPDGVHTVFTRPGSVAREACNNWRKYLWRSFIMLSSALLFTYINAVAIQPGASGTIGLAQKMAEASSQYDFLPGYLAENGALGVKYRGVIATFFFNLITGMGVADSGPIACKKLYYHLRKSDGEYNFGREPDSDNVTVNGLSRTVAWCVFSAFVLYAGVVGWSNFITLAKVGSDALEANNNFGSEHLSWFFSVINPKFFSVDALGLKGDISLVGLTGFVYMMTLSTGFTFDPVHRVVREIRADWRRALSVKNVSVGILVGIMGYLAASAVATQVEFAHQKPLGLYEPASILGSASLEVPAFFTTLIGWACCCCCNKAQDQSNDIDVNNNENEEDKQPLLPR